jgi:hypothetical protein
MKSQRDVTLRAPPNAGNLLPSDAIGGAVYVNISRSRPGGAAPLFLNLMIEADCGLAQSGSASFGKPIPACHFDDMLFRMSTPGALKNPHLAPCLSVRQNFRNQHYPAAVRTIPLYE